MGLSAADGIKLIHEAYAEPENTPRPARNKNVIYWTVLQDPVADPVSTSWNAEGQAGTVLLRSTNVESGRFVAPGERACVLVLSGERAAAPLVPNGPLSGTHIPVVTTTLKYQLIIVCYGPACEAYASRIRHMLFLDGRGFPRQILRAAGIYPIPDPPQPQLLHEEEGSLWRKRADLTIELRVREELQGQARSSINTVPAVIIQKGF